MGVPMSGTVGILSVGAGHTKLSFDPANPADRIRAARIVKDMLRRGYALLVETGETDADGRPIMTRAKDFDETKCEYIIADFDPMVAAQEEDNERRAEPSTASKDGARAEAPRPRSRKRVPAESVKAVAVARSAGG
jgi:hypothetical protein